MPLDFTSSGNTNIPTSTKVVRIIAIGEGGTGSPVSSSFVGNGTAGGDTEFLVVRAGGGTGGSGSSAGTGGINYPIPTGSRTIASIAGNDGSSRTGGAGQTITPMKNSSPITKGVGGNGGSGSVFNPATCTFFGGFAGPCPSNLSQNGTQNQGTFCLCCQPFPSSTTPYSGGGGGGGAYIESELPSAIINPYINSSQPYTVNGGGAMNNGLLEIMYKFGELYVKTSKGWQIIKNVYVKSNSSGWQECGVNLL